METVQIGLAYLILLVTLPVAVLPAGMKMGKASRGEGAMGWFAAGIGQAIAGMRVAAEPSGGGGPVGSFAGPEGTVFFDKEVSFPVRRVLYPALFVYGPTSLAR